MNDNINIQPKERKKNIKNVFVVKGAVRGWTCRGVGMRLQKKDVLKFIKKKREW